MARWSMCASLVLLVLLGLPALATAQPASLGCDEAQAICRVFEQAPTDDADADGCTDLADVAPHDPLVGCSVPTWCGALDGCASTRLPSREVRSAAAAPSVRAASYQWVTITSEVPLEVEAGQLVEPRDGGHQQLVLTRSAHIPAHRPIRIRTLCSSVERKEPDIAEPYALRGGRLTVVRARLLDAIDAPGLLAEVASSPRRGWEPRPEGRAEVVQHALWGEQIERGRLSMEALGIDGLTYTTAVQYWAVLRSRLPAPAR